MVPVSQVPPQGLLLMPAQVGVSVSISVIINIVCCMNQVQPQTQPQNETQNETEDEKVLLPPSDEVVPPNPVT